ncbi:nucleotide pyrophosphatase/phosphodiesterase family protein [Rhodotorula paludigena]|uniref:nucleotide pyrophosphatase/phosphodiesterase family protein n=1 Tax=Rhodotorula paludigena TaxID=86838 RepID=UPI0031811EB3
MAPSVLPQYASLPGESSVALPLARLSTEREPRSKSGASASTLDVPGRSDDSPEEETEYEDRDGRDPRRGLLSGKDKADLDREDEDDELDEELVRAEAGHKPSKRPLSFTLRTVGFTALSIIVVVLLAGLFHPSSPYAHSLSSYLGGSSGVYSPSAASYAPNPLPADGKFGDIPFAKVGQSWDKSGKTPTWAGGDWGEKDYEAGLKAGGGKRWNGTHWWDPTVLLVSLDGVRADYLERGMTPHLLDISRKGVRAKYLKPSFPSLTFPNHWSLLTGLYPSAHGIVANDFWDPSTRDEFEYTEPSKSWGSEWWGGEPIWATAVKNKLRSAVLMWPGPPVMESGIKPSLFYPFINKFHYHKKVERVAKWLDMDFAHRPHLMAVYAPEVDQAGHRVGPHGTTTEKALQMVDEFVRQLFDVVDARNLTDIVDVVVVSDHGMADTNMKRLVYLDDILGADDFARITHNEGWPSAGLRFAEGTDESAMLAKLQRAAQKPNSGFDCYTQETMPERWHFTGHRRIAPIYCVPHVGWAITSHHELEVVMNGSYAIKGAHGYDNDDPQMQAIFVAHGPFASRLKMTSRFSRRATALERDAIPSDPATTVIPGFANTELYELVAELLHIPVESRAQTNGTSGFWDQYLVPFDDEGIDG